MKAIILSAGLGTRLKSTIPKSLTILKNGKTILDYQIEHLTKKIGLENIVIVVGHKKELILEKFPYLVYKENKNFQSTNTSKSLLAGLKNIDEDIIWLNGDIYFDEKVLDIMLTMKDSCCLVNREQCGLEEVKYLLDNDGYISGLSKKLIKSDGEALGINVIIKKDLSNFKKELEEVNDNDYFEKALENLIISKKIQLKPLFIGKIFCKEIDFALDLEEVVQYLNK